MKLRLFLLIAVFVAFAGWTGVIIAEHGYLGFLEVPMASAWGAQVGVDLVIALVLFAFWMIPDSKQLGLPGWLYFVAILFTGSIGALAYLIHRQVKASDAPVVSAAAA